MFGCMDIKHSFHCHIGSLFIRAHSNVGKWLSAPVETCVIFVRELSLAKMFMYQIHVRSNRNNFSPVV